MPTTDEILRQYFAAHQGSSTRFGRGLAGFVRGGSKAASAAAGAFSQKPPQQGIPPGGTMPGYDPRGTYFNPTGTGDTGMPNTSGGFDPCGWAGPVGSWGYQQCTKALNAITDTIWGDTPEGAEPGEADPCPTGYHKVGGTCVATSPGAYLPGGQPATVPASGTPLGTGWEAVAGSFGMPAMTPLPVQRTRLECPAGMVLGKDNLCYPRSTPGLGRRGSFRKWKGDPKPKVSAAEWKTLQRAARTADKIKDVAKEAGFTVKKRGR